ncbi:MAG TPA: hypothetical protein VFQ53_33245 [Kofleriaceae bacterium]|nr:hypothetical protein [Kofleriaceae bacterium]
MKQLSLVVASLALLTSLAGCEQAKVHVNCVTTAAPAVECEVTQTAGKSEVEACWEFVAECGNGTVVSAPKTCQKVSNGGTAKVTIPGDKLTNVDKCGGDKPPKAKLTNLTLNGQAQEQ